MKKLTLTSLALLTFGLNAYALETNVCDDLIRDKAPQAQIDKCLASKKFGKSEFYLAHEAEREAALSQMIETEFTKDDLNIISNNLPIFGSKGTMLRPGFEEKVMLTEGVDLCRVLGFTKAKEVLVNHVGIKGHYTKIGGKVAVAGNKQLVSLQSVSLRGDPNISTYFPIEQITCVKTKNGNDKILELITEQRIPYTKSKEEPKVSEEKAEAVAEVEVKDDSRSFPERKVQDFSARVYDNVQIGAAK